MGLATIVRCFKVEEIEQHERLIFAPRDTPCDTGAVGCTTATGSRRQAYQSAFSLWPLGLPTCTAPFTQSHGHDGPRTVHILHKTSGCRCKHHEYPVQRDLIRLRRYTSESVHPLGPPGSNIAHTRAPPLQNHQPANRYSRLPHPPRRTCSCIRSACTSACKLATSGWPPEPGAKPWLCECAGTG